MNHINNSSYDKYEQFDSHEAILNYRESKLKGIEDQVEFIKSEFNGAINMVELGSGNCKLPIFLSKIGAINKAYAYEISENRHKFAKEWIKYEGIDNISPICSSFIDIENKYSNIDLVIGVDIIFQFINPIQPGYDIKLLKQVYSWMNYGGKIIIEIANLEYLKNTKSWEEFEELDPWRFSLWDCRYDEENNFLYWDKTFIGRDNCKLDKSSLILQIYSTDEIINLLNAVGFYNIRIYDNWNKDSFTNKSFEYIIVAEK